MVAPRGRRRAVRQRRGVAQNVHRGRFNDRGEPTAVQFARAGDRQGTRGRGVIARLAARHKAIVAAARALASESGMGAVQIVPVAERAGLTAGTVYCYFPSKKGDLVAALVAVIAECQQRPEIGLKPPV
jgi:Bacterial regulatory proteins, tetR family